MTRPAAPTPETLADLFRRLGYQEQVALYCAVEARENALRDKYLLLTQQHARLCDQVYEDDGETLKQDALRERYGVLEQDRDEWRESVAGCGAELEGANNHIVQLQDDLMVACQRAEAAEQALEKIIKQRNQWDDA